MLTTVGRPSRLFPLAPDPTPAAGPVTAVPRELRAACDVGHGAGHKCPVCERAARALADRPIRQPGGSYDI